MSLKLGPRKSGSQFFFKKFFTNIRQKNTQDERAFSSKGAMSPSIFGNICLTIGIENSSMTWGYM